MLSPRDRAFIARLPQELPLTPRPFAVLAAGAGLDEAAVIDGLKRLQRRGVLRYVAPLFDLRRLGIVSTLVALKVTARHIPSVVRAINAYGEVTHNYQRRGEYNIWFTLSAPTERRLRTVVRRISRLPGVTDALDLRTRNVYKSRAVFPLKG